MFCKETRDYITKLVRQRIKLYQMGKSKNPGAIRSAEHLKKYLEFYSYKTDAQMATFVINNLGHILNIIPGRDNPAHVTIYTKVQEIKNNSIIILNNYK